MAIKLKRSDATDAWRPLITAYARVNHHLDQELRSELGLSLSWYEVLLLLATADGERLRMTELADQTILSKSATTRLVDRMEAKGLVERSSCDSDRRGTEVGLTGLGRDTFIAAGRLHFTGIQEHFGAHLTPDEMSVIAKALERVADANS